QNWKLPVCYDDDDDEERSDSLDDNINSGLPPFSAITPNEPVLSIEEPDNSLSKGDEHLDTILATESDEFIKSSVKNLIPVPSESEGIPEHKCDVPSHDNSPPLDVSKDQFEDFSKSNDDFSSIDDDSFSIDKIDYVEASPPDSELVSSEVREIVIPEVGGIDDDILRENLLNVNHIFAKIEASNDNPIPFYDPIIFGTPLTLTPSGESDLFLETKSSSASLNSLLEETNNFDNSLPEFTTFSNVLFDAEYESDSKIIPMKIDQHPDNAESDLMESLRTHDFSLPILSKIDSLLEEFADELTLIKSIPPRIDETDCDFEEDIRLIEKLLYDNSFPHPPEEFDDDYDSERDILILKDLPSNNTLSFAEKESFHFDIPPFSRPHAKPLDGDTGILNIKMMGDKLMITLAPHQEKSPDLLSHRGLMAFQPFAKCPMMIHGQNNPILDVLLFHFYPP
nr:hypothetical protein [Tanacetum cinerariifolium]